MDKREQIIRDYHCNDVHAEDCDCSCNSCKQALSDDLKELEVETRAKFADYMKNVAHIDVSEYLYEYEKEKANDYFKKEI